MSYIGYKRTIQLDFNYDAVKQGVPKVNQQMALLNSEFNKASAQVNATGSAMDKLTISNQKLANQVQLQKDKVGNLQKELDKLTSSETKNERAIASKKIELNNAQAQLTRYQQSYAASNIEIAKSNTLMGQAKLAIEDFRLGCERAGVNLDQVKGQFTGLVTAVTAFTAVTGKAFMDYESNLVMARNLMDESVMSYDELNKGVMDLSNQYGIAAKDMAKAAETALSSNIATADSLKFLGEASKFAISTGTDLNTTVDMMTSLMNSYGLTVNDTGKMMDELIATQKKAKVTWEDYNSQIGNLAALGATVGVSLEEINAALVVQTRKGIDSATALTNLKGIISAISSPTSTATTTAKELGISFDASTLKGKGFASVMDKITKATRGNDEAMASLFGNVRAWTGAQVIAANGGEEYKQVLEELKNVNGDLDTSFENVTDTTSHKFKASLEKAKNALVEMGEAISPVIDAVAVAIDTFAGLPKPILLTIAGTAALSVTISILSKLFSGLSMTGGLVGKVLSGVGLSSAGATIGMGTAGATGGILSKVFSALGISAGTASASMGATSATAGATSASMGATAATTGVASAGLMGVGTSGMIAGTGLMSTGMGAQVALGPLLIIVGVVALLVGLLIGLAVGASKAKSEMKQLTNTASEATKSANSAISSAQQTAKKTNKGYATGTNYVKEDGYYNVGENGPERIWLNRGNSVDNASKTRKDSNNKVDMSETNSLLKTLCSEIVEMKRAYQEQPRQMQRLAREGGY